MPSRLDNINEQRRQKLERLRARGVNPYPQRFQQTHTTQEAIDRLEKTTGKTPEKVSVAGRIMAIRKMGKSSFLDIHDGSGKLQLLFQNVNLDEEHGEIFKDLDIGDIIGVEGTLIRTKTGEPTVAVQDFTMLAKSLQPLPEKWHGSSSTSADLLRWKRRYCIHPPEAL
jgi:lysyl-tRNA synthetase class 2